VGNETSAFADNTFGNRLMELAFEETIIPALGAAAPAGLTLLLGSNEATARFVAPAAAVPPALQSVLADSATSQRLIKVGSRAAMVRGTFASAELADGAELPTLVRGFAVKVERTADGGVRLRGPLNAVNVVEPDIPICGGVVHAVDGLLVLPPQILLRELRAEAMADRAKEDVGEE